MGSTAGWTTIGGKEQRVRWGVTEHIPVAFRTTAYHLSIKRKWWNICDIEYRFEPKKKTCLFATSCNDYCIFYNEASSSFCAILSPGTVACKTSYLRTSLQDEDPLTSLQFRSFDMSTDVTVENVFRTNPTDDREFDKPIYLNFLSS